MPSMPRGPDRRRDETTLVSTYGREELPVKTYKNVVDTSDDGKVTLTKEDITNIDDFSTAITPNFFNVRILHFLFF